MDRVGDAIDRNLPPCPKCDAHRGDPCRLPTRYLSGVSAPTTKPHKAREEAHAKEIAGAADAR